MTVPYLRLFSLSYAGTFHVSLTLASSFRIICYDDRSQFPTCDKDSRNLYTLDGNTGVQENGSMPYRMIGTSYTGIILTSNKVLHYNIQHVYDSTWKMVT